MVEGGYCDAVRVLGLSNRRSPPLPFCYLWKDLSEDPLIVQASNIGELLLGLANH